MHFKEIDSGMDSSEMVISVGFEFFLFLYIYVHTHVHTCMLVCGQEEVRRPSLLPTRRRSLIFIMLHALTTLRGME